MTVQKYNHKLLLLLMLLIQTLFVAASPAPRWVNHKPSAQNETYRYVIESAVANSEDIARNKAMGLVLQQTIMSLGLPFNSTQVEKAISTGSVESMTAEFKIPINRVCTYREKLKNGGVRVYVLCQVAVAGNIQVQFTEFTQCGDGGDLSTVQIDGRPDEWAVYETDEYFSTFKQQQLEKNQKETNLLAELQQMTKKELLEELSLTDEVLVTLVDNQSYYDKKDKRGYAVAFIRRRDIIRRYRDQIDDHMYVAENHLKDVDSRIEANDPLNAKATLSLAEAELKEVDRMLFLVNAYETSYSVENSMRNADNLKRKVESLRNKLNGNYRESQENKITEYINIAHHAEMQGKIGDALRYFYAAQVLLAELPNGTTFKHNIPEVGKDVFAHILVDKVIDDILQGITFTHDGYLPNDAMQGKLSANYKGKPVGNLSFYYNANTGWSDEMTVKDGWSVIVLPDQGRPESIYVRINYRQEDKASVDPTLQAAILKHQYDHDTYAMKTVPLSKAKLKTVSLVGEAVATNAVERAHTVDANQQTKYQQTISKICDCIESGRYESAYSLCTPNGYSQFNYLIHNGKARIISRGECRYVRLGQDIQCRAIPMSFTFSKGKKLIENVVFTLNEQGLVDGVQFALDEISAKDIMANTEASESSRLTLLNFMENYKTAFSLKNADYIESIFADNAIIITGRVLKKTDMVDSRQLILNDNVKYTQQTKAQYISRLRDSFARKEWINIDFGNTEFKLGNSDNIYAIRLLQDYSSSNYGDRGYLFLLIDNTNPEQPLIRVRAWQAETAGKPAFSLSDYEYLTNTDL